MTIDAHPIDSTHLHQLLHGLFDYQMLPPLETYAHFDLQLLADQLRRRYQLENFTLSTSSWNWKELTSSLELGEESPLIIKISFSPSNFPFYWVISKSNMAYLLSSLLSKGTFHPSLAIDNLLPTVQKELQDYLIAALLADISQQPLPIKVKGYHLVKAEELVENEISYQTEITIAVGNRTISTPLFILKEDHDRFYAHLQKEQHTAALTSTQANEISLELDVTLPVTSLPLENIYALKLGDLVRLPMTSLTEGLIQGLPVEIYYQDMLAHTGQLNKDTITLDT